MKRDEQDRLYREMALRYMEQYGAELRRELDDMEQGGPLRATPRLDRLVGRRLAAGRRHPYMRGLGLLAACVLLVLLVPRLVFGPPATPSAEPGASHSGADIRPEDAVPHSEADIRPEDAAPPGQIGIIPLSFTLPVNMRVTDVKLDNGKTVYHLADTRLDDVVMTLEQASPETGGLYAALTPVTVNDSTAYASAGPDYSLLAFETDGIAYVLTCRHDVNTLVDLGKNIL